MWRILTTLINVNKILISSLLLLLYILITGYKNIGYIGYKNKKQYKQSSS